MKENSTNIPTVEPDFALRVDFNKDNCITDINIDWKKFYGSSRKDQIDMLECILGWLKELPTERIDLQHLYNTKK